MNDVLSDIFNTIELKATFYFRTEFYPPFGMSVPKFKRASRFHLIVQGQCFVRLDNGTVVAALPGDLVFVPSGNAHLLASDPAQVPTLLEDAINESGFSGQGPFVIGVGAPGQSCQMICGHFAFIDGADHPVLQAVPEILHISAADRAAHPMLDDVLRLIARRVFSDTSGAAASIGRLSEVLFIEVIRAGLAQFGGENKIMAAVNDPQIGRALAAIHGNIAKHWTVDALGREAGMSRTRFAQQFREMVGSSPMSYVAEWRLQRSLHLLGDGRLAVKAVAATVGFRSVAAFSRAFRARFGRAPSEQRQHENPR